jgi:MinD superfamily P-loop ATPase
MRIVIDQEKCVGCGVCHEACSKGLMYVKSCKTHIKSGCDACGACIKFCICSAISIEGQEGGIGN